MPHMDAVWFGTLPRSKPAVGRVAIFDYNGVWHVAFVSLLEEDGFVIEEGNFHHCARDQRLVQWNDPYLVGFWSPEGSDLQ